MIKRQSKETSAEEALRSVRSSDRVYIHPGCATPEPLAKALTSRAPELRDVEIVHLLTFGAADYIKPEMEGHFRHQAFFIGSNVREAVNAGRADFVPIFLGEIERLFSSGALPIDVALLHVSPSDDHGFCSLGVGVDTRADVHYVVTEYGVAYLFGKSIRERVRALIRIAHPKFREELAEWAIQAHYITPRDLSVAEMVA